MIELKKKSNYNINNCGHSSVVERLVANEKVEGSTPFARSKKIVIKSKYITSVFQRYLNNRDIRSFKNSFVYYLLFRFFRNFLVSDIIIQIYNFKIFGSIKRKKTSYFLLKKCNFGDYYELDLIKKMSNLNKILLVDCGCNYGFYSFFAAKLSKKNIVISIEASKDTSKDFLRNLKLNDNKNIYFENKAISNLDNINISFNEGENDWESSQAHRSFKIKKVENIQTITIDTLLKPYDLNNYKLIIKLDIEGNEMNAIQGALRSVKNYSPIFIIEFSKYIFDHQHNIEYLNNFLKEFNYSIYDLNKKKMTVKKIIIKLNQLKKRFKTIGNYYLINNSSENLNFFLNE